MQGTAIQGDWVDQVKQTYDKLPQIIKTEYDKYGIDFNKGLMLILILPIHYSNLRSLDVNNVSITCVGMFLVCEILCFVISSFCFMQVIKTFGIHDLFCDAIKECTNIAAYSSPLLLKNKSGGTGNVSKIISMAHHCFMIYIAHLYQARVLIKKL